WGAVREVFYQNRHFWLPFSVYSAPYSLIPGYLGRLWPWEYWVHVLVLVTFCGTLWTILRAAGLPLRAGGILLLGWGASPMLLSHAVEGYPWASAFLPHALALWITTSPSLRRRPLLTLLAALMVDELSWHVYELGKTVAVVFLAGTVLLPRVPRSTRAAWLVAALAQLGEVLFVHPTANINAFVYQRSSPWPAVHPGLGAVMAGVAAVARAIATLELDLPVLLAAGVASCFFFRRDRRFLVALLLVQLGLVVLLAIFQADQLRPRRFIMVEGYCLVAIAWMCREASAVPRRLIAALLVLGNVWQGAELIGFFSIPFAGTSFMMPYTYSREGVGLVTLAHVDWAHALRREVEEGRRVLLLYNLDCYPENFTNPSGVLERLYLRLGHERFVRSVFVFGSRACRYCCLPIHPLTDFEGFLDGVHPGGLTPPADLVIYFPTMCKGPGAEHPEVDGLLVELGRRFRLRLTPSSSPVAVRLVIDGEQTTAP
ncbi:MAG TPA: hypothetical protein VE911_06485, partial [Candidatus Nitrosopolaris sp.]|nr:hypothetical protein [Candidatus Nitrosopolaris sp.]